MFEAPKNVAELDDDALKASIEEADKAGRELSKVKDEDYTDDQLAEAEAILAFKEVAASETTAREQVAAERSAKIAALRSAVAEPEADKDEAPSDEVEAPSADEAPAEIPAVENAEAKPEAEKESAVTDQIVEPQAASARKSTASMAAKSAPKPEVPAAQGFSLVAAANVPGIAAGSQFNSLADASGAILNQLKALPSGGMGQKFKTRAGALVFKAPEGKLNQRDFRNDTELLMAASQESRLAGSSLVAAGSWGAPSEQVLDFCSVETTDGLFDMSEITMSRGGLSYTKGPNFEDVLNSSVGFWDMTEATAEAGVELKTALRPEVPDFTEVRLDAVGVMMEAGLLLRAGWPELVERYASMALIVHAMKMSAKKLNGVRAYTGPAKDISGGFGNELDILHILELVVQGERQRFAMADGTTMEGLLPYWVKAAMRAGLSNRTGIDLLKVTDAMIEGWFADRGVRVQWLRGMQDLTIDPTADVATQYPNTIEAILYPAGTYVAGVSDVITLDTVYDSVNLKKNDYVHLFVEQGLAVANPCNEGRRLEIPLNITGNTAAANLTTRALQADVVVTP